MRPLSEADKAGGFDGIELSGPDGLPCAGMASAEAFETDFGLAGNALSLSGHQTSRLRWDRSGRLANQQGQILQMSQCQRLASRV